MEHGTLEALRTLWPIVLTLVLLIIAYVTEATMNKTTRKEFEDFKKQVYPKDREGLTKLIQEVRDAQERAELRLEAKLEKLTEQSSSQLEKVFSKINETNILLAELKGRLSNNPQLPELLRNN